MKKILAGCLLITMPSCGDIGRKKHKKNEPLAVDPIVTESPIPSPSPSPSPSPTPAATVEPTPTPTPTPTPSPSPQPETWASFQTRAFGRWLIWCRQNTDGKTSWMSGVDLHDKDFAFLTFYFPNNTRCEGSASPADGDPKSYAIESTKALENGWFLVKGNCRNDRCRSDPLKHVLFQHHNKIFYAHEARDPNYPADVCTTSYPNGPFR